MKINLLISLVLFFLFIIDSLIYKNIKTTQLNEIFTVASNIEKELENSIQTGVNSVKFLNASAQSILANKKNINLVDTLNIEEIDTDGNYALDNDNNRDNRYEERVNLTGYNGLKKDKETQLEMEMSLLLTPIYEVIKESNDIFSWVYYYSNKDFMTLYPFLSKQDFVLEESYKEKPIFQFATPKNNPKRELFFTPLYMDGANLDLMVTLGMPLYDKDEFLGVTQLDITLAKQTQLLERLDYLNNNSLIVNTENEVIAVNNIASVNLKKVTMIHTLVKNEIIALQDTTKKLVLIDGKYVYSKKFTNAPWKFIYYKKASEIELISILYTLPILFLMILVYYIGGLLKKSNKQTQNLELMMRELNHRVKNNFQVILTFLWAQKKHMSDDASFRALEQTKQRIYAISSLHELLDVTDNVSIDIKTYIKGITNSFSEQQQAISYTKNSEDILLNYDEAISIGLTLNELITNSVKYAFKGIKEPKIDINFFIKDGMYVLKYSDNGIGCSEDKLKNSTGLGHDLIEGIAQKNSAEISIDSSRGFAFSLSFKVTSSRS